MCGIAGLFRAGGIGSDDPGTVARMLQAIRHRGPDDEGRAETRHVVLGHRRLSIIDTSDRGHQPMARGDWLIVFNGEIYNYLELRGELEGLGEKFETGSDTEVLLAAWSRWGEACLERLEGMWAFALHHRASHELVLARDPFGIKPLYLWADGASMHFASEIKALIAAGAPARVHAPVLAQYLVTGMSDYSTATFFADIEQLPPGGVYVLAPGRVLRRSRYYDLAAQVQGAGPTEIDDYHAALKRSIELHLRSDVPVGTCLSGGLDSSTVAAIASAAMGKRTSRPFAAITASSEDPRTDEVSFARSVANHARLDWSTIRPDYEDFAADLRACLSHQDEPVVGPSIYLQYAVMREAKRRGIKVLLDGQGGDETLLGYERYYATYFRSCLGSGRIAHAAREFWAATRNSKLGFAALLASSAIFALPEVRRRHWHRRARIFTPDVWALVRMPPELGSQSTAGSAVTRLQIDEITRLQMPRLLRYEDRNSMAHGIEARVPFVLPRCIEVAVRLRPEDKIRGGYTKYALRTLAERHLPASIAWRRSKVGFEAPWSAWAGRHADTMRAQVARSALLRGWLRPGFDLARIDAGLAWRVYNVALWEEMHSPKL